MRVKCGMIESSRSWGELSEKNLSHFIESILWNHPWIKSINLFDCSIEYFYEQFLIDIFRIFGKSNHFSKNDVSICFRSLCQVIAAKLSHIFAAFLSIWAKGQIDHLLKFDCLSLIALNDMIQNNKLFRKVLNIIFLLYRRLNLFEFKYFFAEIIEVL
jgi:hypothetical protein